MDNNIFLNAIIISAFLLLLGWSIYLTIKISKYEKEKKEMMKNLKKAGVEGLLRKNLQQIEKTREDIEELYQISEKLGEISSKSITKIGVVRFNPFGDTGGDQSFSIALLNSRNDGIVISSLHGRGGTRIYSKPIKQGTSEYNLTNEEKKAIEKA